MRTLNLFTLLLLVAGFGFSQSNIVMTNAVADQVIRGNFNPANYLATNIQNHPNDIVNGVKDEVSSDSLKAYLEILTGFENRNSGSDTLSSGFGMGAARRWAYHKFNQFSAANENRLLPGYLQFDRAICGMTQHRNVVAVLPGMDTANHAVVLIEGHMDSRCASLCDITCSAHGADDNGSGTVLVMELARVLSKYSFNQTLVFMLTTAEEQGLFGAEAMADYVWAEGIPVKCVLNNDVIGGTLCGNTASFPGCGPVGDIDSVNVRMYSYGTYNSPHKSLTRFVKLQYQEELKPNVEVPMTLNIMNGEDRSGRGGDHIPFRQKGITSMRFTSANEHGNGAPGPGYLDHQHTSADSIGIDLDNNGTIDSFWVDFNYLARNCAINGNAAGMAALGPLKPDLITATAVPGGAELVFTAPKSYPSYRVGVRTLTHDWDTLYTIYDFTDTIYFDSSGTYIIQVATLDSNGVESLFSNEMNVTASVGLAEANLANNRVEMFQNAPNPVDEYTNIMVKVFGKIQYQKAEIVVRNVLGQEESRQPISLEQEINSVLFHHGFGRVGIFFYTLEIDGDAIATKKMVLK